MTLELETCNALWIGRHLPPFAAVCLSSFVEQGHRVRLFVYDEPSQIPPGIELSDAGQIVPRDRIMRHRRTGSYALFSDMFRYELQAREMGVWIDCDVLSVRPIPKTDSYLFGYQDRHHLNVAVLKLPSNVQILRDLRAMFADKGWSPPWYPRSARMKHWLRSHIQSDYGHQDLEWGVTSPYAMTYFANHRELMDQAKPTEVFYPVGYELADGLLDPEFDVRRFIKPATLTIHLWAELIKRKIDKQARPGSFITSVMDGTWREALGPL